MVFGRTYCQLTRLPIEDGDECILIPLGVRIEGDFNKHNRGGAHTFNFIHEFIAEPQRVVYGGNVGMMLHPGPEKRAWDEWGAFMLLRVDAWEMLARDAKPIEHVLFLPAPGMWRVKEMITKIDGDARHKAVVRCLNGEITRDKIADEVAKPLEVPMWMSQLNRLAWVMWRLGIQPQDHTGNDQSGEGGETLWRIIDEIRGRSTDKDEPSPVP